MAIRSIASLSLTFGLVSIPVKVYLATESSVAIRFKLMASNGARLRQQYVEDSPPVSEESERPTGVEPAESPKFERDISRGATVSTISAIFPGAVDASTGGDGLEQQVVERADMVKGYEFQKGKFVLFAASELKELEAASRQTIDIVAFIPEQSVDPIYFDKAYFLAPEKRGGKPYSLLRRAMSETGRCALAKWAWRSKEYVVQIRAVAGGMVLQQLLYADEVRSIDALDIDLEGVSETELKLATQLIEQIAAASYDPHAFVDEEKQRILAAVERKIAGERVVSHGTADRAPTNAHVVDLAAALRASLSNVAAGPQLKRAASAEVTVFPVLKQRKPARRAPSTAAPKARKSRKA